MNWKTFIFIILLLPLYSGISDKNYSFPADGGKLITDPLGNFYIYTESSLSQFDRQGKNTAIWNAAAGSEISSVDVSKPFKVLVYSAAANSILFLDNTLSLIDSPISLSELGIDYSIAACSSYDDAFWVFDGQEHALLRFNSYLKETDKAFVEELLIVANLSMIENKHHIFVYQDEEGLYQYDRYGSLLRVLPLNNIKHPDVSNSQFAGLSGDNIIIYNLEFSVTDTLRIEGLEVQGFCLLNQGYALCSPDSVHIFQEP